MLMSDTHKFIFIHIYKTAGTSVMNEFLPYSRLLDRLAYEFRITKKVYGGVINLLGWQDDGMKQFTGYHKHAGASEIEKKLGSEHFASYYKFAFVRNPFDFVVSLYFYILQSKKHAAYEEVSHMSFPEFLKWHLLRNPPLQIDFLMNGSRDKKLVNYIGRFETIAEDVDTIKQNLNIEINGHIEHRNFSVKRKSKNYKDYYDSASRELLFDYFRQDFEMLGYDYDGFQKTMPIIERF